MNPHIHTSPETRIAELNTLITDRTPLRDAQAPASHRRQRVQEEIDTATDTLWRWQDAAGTIATLQNALTQARREQTRTFENALDTADTARNTAIATGAGFLGLGALTSVVPWWWLTIPALVCAAACTVSYRKHTSVSVAAENERDQAQQRVEEIEDELIGTVDYCEGKDATTLVNS